jgi:predicted RNA-binding Zn-ribbon protein involved in translation (DUF1610 family)
MHVTWTCPICGEVTDDDHAARCGECFRNVCASHLKDHRCPECRQRLGLEMPSTPPPEAYQLQLQLVCHTW